MTTAPLHRSPLDVEVTVCAESTKGRCFLRLPPDALRALASERELPDSIAGWPIDGQVRAGIATLTASELNGLERGDLVVLDEAPAERRLVCLPGLTLSGRHEDALFHVEEILMNEAWQQLPATLIVEIARVTLTLRELAALEVGAAFPIHSSLGGAGRVLYSSSSVNNPLRLSRYTLASWRER